MIAVYQGKTRRELVKFRGGLISTLHACFSKLLGLGTLSGKIKRSTLEEPVLTLQKVDPSRTPIAPPHSRALTILVLLALKLYISTTT